MSKARKIVSNVYKFIIITRLRNIHILAVQFNVDLNWMLYSNIDRKQQSLSTEQATLDKHTNIYVIIIKLRSRKNPIISIQLYYGLSYTCYFIILCVMSFKFWAKCSFQMIFNQLMNAKINIMELLFLWM